MRYITYYPNEYCSHEPEGIKWWENTSIYTPIHNGGGVRKYEPRYTKDRYFKSKSQSHKYIHSTCLPKHYSDRAFAMADATGNVTNSVTYKEQWFRRYMSDKKCVICGEEETCCLVHHHTDPSNKETEVWKLVNDKTSYLSDIINEIRKCIIVCLNCHRKIHFHKY